jgi:hypothetical protein
LSNKATEIPGDVTPSIFIFLMSSSRSSRAVQFTCQSKLWITSVIWSPLTHIKVKQSQLQAWTGPEGSRSLRLLDFKTIGTWK